jgi:outer membrane protein
MRSAIGASARSLFLATLLGLAALPARAETLADALIAAYRNSNLIEQNRAVLRAADEDVAQAISALRPTLDFIVSAEYVYQENPTADFIVLREGLTAIGRLVAEMVLFDFGRRELRIEATKETVLATREALIDIEQQVLLAAVVAYVDVRLQEEFVSLRENNVRVIGEQLRAAQDRFEVGEVTRTDVAQAEARLAQARAGLVSAQGDLTIARERYRAATGNYPGNLAPLPTPPRTAESLEAARSVAERTHPSIRQAQRQVAAADLLVQLAKADTRPSVTGSATLGNLEGGLAQHSVGINLRQNLYSGGRLASVIRQAIANREQANSALQQTILNISENVGVSWARIDVADATISATLQQIDAAQIAFEGVREEANLGARTTLDVLDAEQDVLDARNARLQAEAERYISAYQLLLSMGLLTVEHLALGIPTYDPAAYYNAVRRAPAHSAQGKKLDRILNSISTGTP